MELKRYWQIIRRAWWLVALLTLVGVGASYQYYKSHLPSWEAKLTINIHQTVTPTNQNPDNEKYFLDVNLASEYAADDFTHIVVGNLFLKDVASTLKQQANLNLSADELKGFIAATRTDRELFVTVSDANPDKIIPITQAISTVVTDKQKMASYLNFGDAANHPIEATVLDLPTQASQNGGRTFLLAAIYIIVGLLAGIALAFLLAYLDDKVRSPQELEELLSIPVLAAVPPTKNINSASSANPNTVNSTLTQAEPDRLQARR